MSLIYVTLRNCYDCCVSAVVVFSFQEEQAVLEKIVRERRASLAHRSGTATPHIMVSEASIPDRHDGWFFGSFRRASTQSMGPVVVPVSSRSAQRQDKAHHTIS